MPSSAYPVLRPLSELAAADAPIRPVAPAPRERPRPRDHGPAAGLRLVCDRAGFARARAFTRETLRGWSLADRADDAVLVVAELAANAAAHAAPAVAGPAEVRLGISLVPGALLLSVTDPGDDAPVPAPADDRVLREHGRGLHIVDTLADTWGWLPRPPRGKTVWARLPARPPT
ncbi:ATP-binding protein [Streptomyces sp. NPDC023723]|uniref:ATP-binding protein n=1 Tax=Streptomyces sp. NPDC023723 TaxID=3154323 RepID=UPI00340650D8